jgi:asparagine synthase (glutamine-hydrolysing)
LGRIPLDLRKAASTVFDSASRLDWGRITSRGRLATRLYYLAEVTKTEGPDELYWRLNSYWDRPEQVVIDGREPPAFHMAKENTQLLPEFAQRMMYLDFNTYLPDDILVKLDRASMATSLEGRVPFLDDHRVIEFAWRLPLRAKIRSGKGKWILRQVLHRYVPESLVERPKMGFGVPIDSWLRGPLRDWAEALLDENRLRREGRLNPVLIRKRWTEHLQKQKNWQYLLWLVLIYEDWLSHTTRRDA